MSNNIREKKNFVYQYDEVNGNSVKGIGLGVRHVQVLLMFICVLCAYGIRVCLSITIVAMTSKTSTSEDVTVYTDWSKKVQNLVLSAFFIGYLVMQIPAGILATKYGGKIFLTIALVVNGILCLVIPWGVGLGSWKMLLGIRVLQGLSQGCIYPSLSTLLGKWAPLSERSRISNCVYCANSLGPVFAMPISGYLASSHYGWPAVFYFFGGISILAATMWNFLGSDSPRSNKFISEKEMEYIEDSLEIVVDVNEKRSKITPYRAIFTSMPLLAIAVAQTGGTYGFLTFLLEIPSYMNEVYKVDMKSSGWLSALPYVGMCSFSFIACFIADLLVNKQLMSVTDVRKLANTVGMFCPAVGIIIMCMVPSDQVYLAVCVMVLTLTFSSASNASFMVNHVDLSPNFAGIMFGTTNMIGNMFGLLAPNIVGLIVSEPPERSQWNQVFYIMAGVYIFSGIFYLVFGSAERQDWDELAYVEEQKKDEKLNTVISENNFKT